MRLHLSGIALLTALGLATAVQAAAPVGTPITREEALRGAAAQNAGLLARSLDVARADAVATAAYGSYVPELRAEGTFHEVPGQTERSLTIAPAIVYESPIGTQLTASGAVTEGLSGNPESSRTMRIELSQAILRGGLIEGSDPRLRSARLDTAIAKERYRDALNRFLLDVDSAYWELSFALEDLEIKKRSRDIAKTQFEETEENIRRGLLAPGEIFIVEESLTDFEERLTRAEEAVALAEVALARLLGKPSTTVLAPSSPISAEPSPVPNDADTLAYARGQSPSVMAARLEVERRDVLIGAERREALPGLDAFGSVSVSDGTDVFAKPIDDTPTLEAGLRVSIPLYWGPDSARVERARIERRQASLDLEDTAREAESTTKQALIRLSARDRRLELASKIVELSQKKLEVERDKYKSGLSTLADVVRFQRELDAALSASLRAKVDVLVGRSALLSARGDLASTLGIEVR